MASMKVKTGIVFLIQMVIGAMGNIFLLSQYLRFYFNSGKSRSTDVILRHLTVANTLVILSRGIPETMAAFGMEGFLSDAGCKLVFYVHRVGRGASMGSTCLLSVFQAISISPEDWKWKELKVKALKYMSPAAVLCWVLPLMLNIVIPVNVTANQKNKTITHKRDLGYCFAIGHEKVSNSLTTAVLAITDALCMVLMLWASGSMVFVLYTHKQRVHYLHRTNISSKSSPETRAIHSILVLVCTYVTFYTITCTMQVSLSVFYNPSSLSLTVAALMNACFPTVCPFVLMSRDQTISRVCGVYHRRNT